MTKIDLLVKKLLEDPRRMNTGHTSNQKLASRNGLTVAEVLVAKKRAYDIINPKSMEEKREEEDLGIQSTVHNLEKGESKIEFLHTREALSEDEIWKETKLDRTKYNLVQIYHKKYGKGFLYTANFRLKNPTSPEFISETFTQFLSTYEPAIYLTGGRASGEGEMVSLIIPKQDAHFNKLDIQGVNSIQSRMSDVYDSIMSIVSDVEKTRTIEEIVYVVGSDQFNSEWTSLTTKGTPQQNILSYHEAFQQICDFEASMITELSKHCDYLEVVYLPGNHDRFVGWHLVSWLECYFRETSINFLTDMENTKYYIFNNTAVMLNHGDVQKPKDLASKFPHGLKSEWSQCDHFMIITGDKHFEKSLDMDGIQYYQVPQLSGAVSEWDDKNGYSHSKTEMNIFMISSFNGLSRIYKDAL